MSNAAEPGSARPNSLEPDPLPVLRVVAVALVDTEGRVLLARRPAGKAMAGLWEFPGGKIEQGETPQTALIREINEELGIKIEAADLSLAATAAHDYKDFRLDMPLFICRRWKGTPEARESQALAWVPAADMAGYDMPPADAPLVAKLVEQL